ncbi:MAG: phenylalanine--tRNA ligase subunit beta, partial [Ignavibacteriaceae bacterium]
KEIKLRFDRIGKVLGYKINEKNVSKILQSLEFKILLESEIEIHVSVPAFRSDVEREIDLIEEVARIYGYDNIPTITKINISLGSKVDESSFEDKLRETSVSAGLFEIINNPLQSEKLVSFIGKKISIKNPQSLDMAYLRTSLVPGMLQVISNNIKVGEKNLALFEIGNIFNKKSASEIKGFDDLSEKKNLIIAVTGRLNEKEWNSPEKFYDFYYLKGLINSLISKISLDNVLNDSYTHNAKTIYDYHHTKYFNEKLVGVGGKVKNEVLKNFDIIQEVFCYELDIDELLNLKHAAKVYSSPLKFPKILRDFAFIFDKSVTYEEVKNFIVKEGSQLLKSVEIFDLFENENLGNDKKSMAFSLEYFDENRTLKEEEVEKDFVKLISLITKKFNAKLRGN